MQKQLDKIQSEIIEKIYTQFLKKFSGNKLAFAKASGCDEKTIRRLFANKQGMTLNLYFKLCYALETHPSKLFEDLSFDLTED